MGFRIGFRFRKRIKIGPVVLNLGKRGLTSWGLQAGKVSWNERTRQTSIDVPGPGSLSIGGRQRRRKARS